MDVRHILHKIRWQFMSHEKRIMYYRRQGVQIGKGCDISKDISFGTEPYLIKIGDNVRLTSNVRFATHDGGMWVLRNKYDIPDADKFGTIEIGNNVNIGWDTIILPNVQIGNNCVIGAGSVVTKDIPDNSVAAGVPARVIETIDEYYKKNISKIVNTKNMIDKESFLRMKFGGIE